jgi:hypothetical protein
MFSFTLESTIDVLSRTPAVLRALVAPLPLELADATEGPQSWSPRQVVRHMLWGEVDDWMPRLRLILEHGEEVPFVEFDRLGGEARYGDLPAPALVEAFADRRLQNLNALQALRLGPADLPRRGRHPALGPVTVRQLLATWTAHDLSHVHQITRVLARQYREEVGPWREYMTVVNGGA